MSFISEFKTFLSKKCRALFIFMFLSFSKLAVAGDIDNEPSLPMMKDSLVRIVNMLLILVGAVFVFMLAYGAWKASTSVGDPRGIDSAKNTWTYALFGFIVIAGFFAIFTIVARMFGFEIGGVGTILDNFFGAITNLTKVVVEAPEAY